MNGRHLIAALGLALVSLTAVAQTTPSAAGGGKKALVARVLQLQQPGIEGVARLLVEQPAMQMLQAAGAALQQRVAAERREAVGQDIQADVRKFVEESVPPVRKRALELAPTAIAPILEERFSEDELRQLITILESPVNKKFQSMGPEMQRSLVEKLAADVRPSLDPKFRALQQGIAGRLGITPPAAGASR